MPPSREFNRLKAIEDIDKKVNIPFNSLRRRLKGVQNYNYFYFYHYILLKIISLGRNPIETQNPKTPKTSTAQIGLKPNS